MKLRIAFLTALRAVLVLKEVAVESGRGGLECTLIA